MTAPQWSAHHLAGNFVRAGDCDAPIDYRVKRLRDGRRFASRRVLALQGGEIIFDSLCSFHDPEESVSHRADWNMDDVPDPDTLLSMPQLVGEPESSILRPPRRSMTLPFPVEMRIIGPLFPESRKRTASAISGSA